MPEFPFIDWIRQRVVDRPPVWLGIGDDAAILAPSDKPLLVTTDMLMEGTDFTFPETTPSLAGRKSLAVNLSDIAAMGGIPTAAFVSVALPRARGLAFAEAFYEGLLALADEFGVTVAGGDTNTWDQPLAVNVTLLGTPAGPSAITRSGARPGDRIFVTGELGHSIHGHHLTFTPRIAASQQLLELVNVHAMIDISDGLAADLHHILSASGVGAVLDAEAIPLRSLQEAPEAASHIQSNTPEADALRSQIPEALWHACADGEDFELLFTVSPDDARRLEQLWAGPTPLTSIGEITMGQTCLLRFPDGKLLDLPPLGWQHRLSP